MLVYDLTEDGGSFKAEYKETRKIPYQSSNGQGWGLAHGRGENGEELLYATDGSSKLYVVDPETWAQTREVTVKTSAGREVARLNEIEMLPAEGEQHYLLANVWGADAIHLIDVRTGTIKRTWSLPELQQNQRDYIAKTGERNYDFGNAVLNGIAYYPPNDSFFIAGKLWDHIYEVKLDYRDAIQD